MRDRVEDSRVEMMNWARRPPERSAKAARAAVLGSIRNVRPYSGWRLLATGSAAVVLLLLSLVQPAPKILEQESKAGAGAAAVARLESAVIVYQLRSGAKLYVTIPTPAEAVGAEPASRKDGEG